MKRLFILAGANGSGKSNGESQIYYVARGGDGKAVAVFSKSFYSRFMEGL